MMQTNATSHEAWGSCSIRRRPNDRLSCLRCAFPVPRTSSSVCQAAKVDPPHLDAARVLKLSSAASPSSRGGTVAGLLPCVPRPLSASLLGHSCGLGVALAQSAWLRAVHAIIGRTGSSYSKSRGLRRAWVPPRPCRPQALVICSVVRLRT